MNPFRALDERVLPRLARGLIRIAGVVSGSGRGPAAGRRTLTAATVLALAAVAATATYLGNRPAPVDEGTGDVVRVGASEGDLVSAYVERSRSELAAITARHSGEIPALVSFSSYVEPDALDGLLADVTTARVYARVPLPDVQTEIVFFPVNTLKADVPAAMKRTAESKERAARDADHAADGLTGGGAQEKELRAFYRQDAQVSRAEAASYRRLCGCIYGAVVRASPARLTQLAKRDGIRVVDAAPESKRLDRTVFLPLQPEQIAMVTPPTDGSLPSPTKR